MANRGPDIPTTPLPEVVRRKAHLLVIAIDDYQHCPRLYNCRRDADRFIQLLTEQYQFEQKYITTLFDEQATEEQILDAFKKQITAVGPEDDLVVIYSGHGEYEADIDEGYWIPVDAKQGESSDFISNSRIIKYLKAIPAHHILLIVDSCFSGSLFSTRKLEPDASIGRLDNIASRWLLTAGRNEVVADGHPGDNSPFAESILYFLEKNAQASLSISELSRHVTQSVIYNARQTPRGEPLQDVGHRGGQFHFHKKGAFSPAPTIATPVAPKAPSSPPPSPLANKSRMAVIGIVALLGIGIASFFIFNTPETTRSQTDAPLLLFDSLLTQGQQQLRLANDSAEVIRAMNVFQQAVHVAEPHDEIDAMKARTALDSCRAKLQSLSSPALPSQPTAPPPKPEEAPSVSPETQAWRLARERNTEAAFRKYLKHFPKGAHRAQAQEKIAGFYRYQLDIGTSVSNKMLTVSINRGKAPFQITVEYDGQSITKTSKEKVVKISLETLKVNSEGKIASVIVRDANFKAKGVKTLLY
jgi:hypothetical protein